MAKAIITGFDSRACSCCGGLMLTFTSEPQPYQEAFRLVVNEPSELGISSATHFPVHMKVDYELLTLCSGEIKITKFKKLP